MNPVALGVVRHQGCVLLVRRARVEGAEVSLSLSLPGGQLEPGESPEEAVVRAVYQETGVVVAVVSLLAERRQPALSAYYYACDVVADADEEAEEAEEPIWVPRRELRDLLELAPEVAAYLGLEPA